MSAPNSTIGLANAISELLGPIGGQEVRDFTLVEVHEAILEALALGGSSFMELPDGLLWSDVPQLLRQPEHQMTAPQRRAITTAMLVEDHLPGFASEYLRIFPVQGVTDLRTNLMNSTVQVGVYKWLAEENTHRYRFGWYALLAADDPQTILEMQATEGAKFYQAPSYRPGVLFVYTALQEYATQKFYTLLRGNVSEPILRYTLQQIAAEEARHCRFFLKLITPPLMRGDASLYQEIQEMLQHFQMPLSHMLENYLRRAADMRRTAPGYDHREAFEYLARQLRRITETRTTAVKHPINDLVETLDRLTPLKKPLGR